MPLEDRMPILLENLPDIPSGMIFLPGKRITREGFRWAPTTWMIGKTPEYPDPLANPKASPLPQGFSISVRHSVLTPRGLLVRYPGYRLHQSSRTEDGSAGKNALHSTFNFPTDVSLRQRCHVEMLEDDMNAEVISTLRNNESSQIQDVAIICCRIDLGFTSEVALLVLVGSHTKGTLHCRWAARVRISLLSETTIASDPVVLLDNNIFLSIFGEVLPPDQLWTID